MKAMHQYFANSYKKVAGVRRAGPAAFSAKRITHCPNHLKIFFRRHDSHTSILTRCIEPWGEQRKELIYSESEHTVKSGGSAIPSFAVVMR